MSETKITHTIVPIDLLKGAQLIIRAAAERSTFKIEEYDVVSGVNKGLTHAIENPVILPEPAPEPTTDDITVEE